MNKTKIVIVGGGFGGVYTAINLYKLFNAKEIEITLINKSNYFLFTPLLHEVATGGLTPMSIIESIREVFRNKAINFVENAVIEIDSTQKIVKTQAASYSYDYLVVSTGAEVNYFNTIGAEEHSFTLKNLPDAVALRNHILETCEKAVETKNKNLLTTAIVGAGPTGVELAAELKEYMEHTLCTYYKNSGFSKDDIRVNLITTTPDVISQFPQKMRDIAIKQLVKKGINVLLNTFVTKVEPNLLTFKNGTTLHAHTIIWVAGVTPKLSDIKGLENEVTIDRNRIQVNEYLQSTKNPHVFSLGDVSGTYPMLAQVAVQQGKIVAYNICSLMNDDKLHRFTFKQKGLLLSIGQWYAIGNFFGFTFHGKIMWWVWRTAYLFNFHSWKKRFEIAYEWTANLFYPRDITYLK